MTDTLASPFEKMPCGHLARYMFKMADGSVICLCCHANIIQLTLKHYEGKSLESTIEKYYAFRYPDTRPDARQALFFLLTEIGEMVNAWLDNGNRYVASQDELQLFSYVEIMRVLAERIVSGEKPWVRNNDREKEPCLPHEIGDVLMMLTRFSIASGSGDPETCMTEKMRSKGFVG